MGDQVSHTSELDSVNHIEKEAQDDRKWKEKEDSTTIRTEAGNRGVLGQIHETLCKSYGIWIRDQNPEQDTTIHEAPAKHKERCNKEDGSEESSWKLDTMKGPLTYMYQKENDRNKDIVGQGEIQNNTTESADNQDMGEAENDMFFSSPKVRMEKIASRKEKQDSHQLNIDITPESELTTPQIEGVRRTSKFWQTPDGHPSSPFTPEEIQLQAQIEGKSLEVSISKDLQLFLNEDLEFTPEVGISEFEDNSLEQLSEELIKVFHFDNLDKRITSQKERLIQKIIKLGGDEYTVEDLQRDMIKI